LLLSLKLLNNNNNDNNNQMTNLIFKDNSIRTNGDMVCLTDMAKPYGKAVAHWLEIDSTQAYLTALSAAIDIPIASILVVSNGKPTFACPEVAITFNY
jgi:hypothetical protein